MATLEERVCELKYSVVVMQRLMLGMAQEIDTLSEELGYADGDLVGYTTEQRACRSKRILEQERAVRNRAFAGGYSTMAVTELMLPTQETESDLDRLSSDEEQQSIASSKRARSGSSY
eukprot:scaffold151428_cov78-Attheya_sp.AAC.1